MPRSRNTRSRSRSPHRSFSHRSSHRDRDRSRSRSHSHRPHHHHWSHKRTRSPSPPREPLPFSSRPLTKHDYDVLEPIFASYLDVQKGKDLSALDHREQRGRFKSFISHYNRGELARGWYERVVKQLRTPSSASTAPESGVSPPPSGSGLVRRYENGNEGGDSDDDDDDSGSDDVGPPLPGQERSSKRRRRGPDRPGFDDLEIQRTHDEEETQNRIADIRYERRRDRRAQKESLEELVPRAEPGTHERKMEKKKELNDKMRAFREKSPGVGDEVDETTLMGGGDGGESFAAKKAALQRKKNERELRREQILQARIAEREERLQAHREKEEKTMAMLKQLAARNFHA